MNPLTIMTDIPSLSEVLTWPQAVVAVAIVVAVLVVPQIVQMVQNHAMAKQYKNNGGSTLRDAVDRIEHKVTEQGTMLEETKQRLDEHLEAGESTDGVGSGGVVG